MTQKKSPKESIESLVQILSQLEQNLKDAEGERERKELSRHIKNTKVIIERIKSLK